MKGVAATKIMFMTSHVGLGHAARDSAIASALLRLEPGFKISFLTAKPALDYILGRGFRVHDSSYKLESFSRAIEEFFNKRIWLPRVRSWINILKQNYKVLVEDGVFDEPDVIVADEFWEAMLAGEEVKSRIIFITDLLAIEPSGFLLKRKLYEKINEYFIKSFAGFKKTLYTAYYSDNPLIDEVVGRLREKLVYIGPVSSVLDPRKTSGSRDGLTRILVVNGGTSARARVFLGGCIKLLEKLSKRHRVKARIIAGPRVSVEEIAGARGFEAEFIGFKAGLWEEYSESDLVIGRAGRTTIADLECMGVRALLVPIKNHAEQERLASAACSRRFFFECCSEDMVGSDECVRRVERLLGENVFFRDEFTCKGAFRAAMAIKYIALGDEPPFLW